MFSDVVVTCGRLPRRHSGRPVQERQEMRVQFVDWDNLIEQEMAIHSSILVWKIPGPEESGRPQSMQSHGVGHDLATERACTELHVGLFPPHFF